MNLSAIYMAVTVSIKKQVSDLKCDKLSLTLDLQGKKEKDDVSNRLNGLIPGKEFGYYSNKKGYKKSFNLWADDDHKKTFLVQLDPIFKTNKYMRVELNPSNVDMERVVELMDYVLDGGWNRIIADGYVTRIDLAVDLYETALNELLLSCKYVQVEHSVRRHGRVETHYFGSSKSEKQLKAYDKFAQQAKMGITADCQTRIEAKYTNIGCINQVHHLVNLFDHLAIVDAKPVSMKPFGKPFVAIARNEGIKSARLAFGNDLPSQISNALEMYVTRWWVPQDIWSQLDDVINDLLSVQSAQKLNLV